MDVSSESESAQVLVFAVGKWIIHKAVEAVVYPQTCQQLARELQCLDILQEHLQHVPSSRLMKVQQPWIVVKNHLDYAIRLVNRCSHRSRLYNFLMNTEKEIVDVRAKIQMSVTLLLVELQCHNQNSNPATSRKKPIASSTYSIKIVAASIPASTISGAQSHTKPRAVQVWEASNEALVSARSFSIAWGNEPTFWRWIRTKPESCSYFSEVAYLDRVAWLELSARASFRLLPGKYTISWRVKIGHSYLQASSHGWNTHPVQFAFCTNIDGQSGQCRTLLEPSGWQRAGCNIRNVEDGWKEFDIGNLVVSPDNEKPVDLKVSMMETEGEHWKGDIYLDGVVVRPTSHLVDIQDYYADSEDEYYDHEPDYFEEDLFS